MKNKDIPKYIVGIVLLVAIVGIIVLLLNTGSLSLDESTDHVGFAVGQATLYNTKTCSDTENESSYLIKGEVKYISIWKKSVDTDKDNCKSDDIYSLEESYCVNSTAVGFITISCQDEFGQNFICEDGACVEKDTASIEKLEAASSELEKAQESKALKPELAGFAALLSLLGLGGLGGLLFVFLLVALFVFFLFYVYVSLVLMTIAKRTGTPYAWLAWIPIANIYLMTQIGKLPWWLTFGVFLAVIPYVGALAFLVLCSVFWWKIAEARNRPGWWGIVIILVPIINLILMGILAWSKDGTSLRQGPNHAKLITYFRGNMAQGYKKEQIAAFCIKHGYTKEEVDAVQREI